MIVQIIHHLNDSLDHTPRLIARLHNRTDTEAVVLLHQLHIRLEISFHQTCAVIDLPVFGFMYHLNRFKILVVAVFIFHKRVKLPYQILIARIGLEQLLTLADCGAKQGSAHTLLSLDHILYVIRRIIRKFCQHGIFPRNVVTEIAVAFRNADNRIFAEQYPRVGIALYHCTVYHNVPLFYLILLFCN